MTDLHSCELPTPPREYPEARVRCTCGTVYVLRPTVTGPIWQAMTSWQLDNERRISTEILEIRDRQRES